MRGGRPASLGSRYSRSSPPVEVTSRTGALPSSLGWGYRFAMAHHDEGYVQLPACAARASVMHKLVLDDVDAQNRANIVWSGIGPQEVPIIFRADGIVVFEFHKSELFSGGSVEPFFVDDKDGIPKEALKQIQARNALREKRFRYMNAFLTCFHVAVNISNKFTPPSSQSHYIWAREEQGIWRLMDNGAGLIGAPPYALTIGKDKIEEALSDFLLIEGISAPTSLDTLDLFYRAAFNMNHHEYQTVLILGWAIVEGAQDLIWQKLIGGGYKRFNPHSKIAGKRKALLLTDRNFTASIKSQVLALTGEHLDWELERVDRVRRRRNSFMHSLEPISISDAFDAMWACGTVAKKALNLKLSPFGNPGGWDYKR